MNLKATFTIILATTLILMTSQPSHARDQHHLYLEAAPLQGLMGQPSFRVEAVFSKFSLGANFERNTSESDRDQMKDTTTDFGLEGLWYPFKQENQGLFLGGGLQYESELIGKQKVRDTLTWEHANSDEMHDRWTLERSNILTTESIGYRYFFDNWFTASIRVSLDQLMSSNTMIRDEDISSRDPDLSGEKRASTKTHFMMHAGVAL